MARELPLTTVRPSQLYLSDEKLAAVIDWFDFEDPEYDPLPMFEYQGDIYLSDGHTRAFAAYLSGAETLRVEHDETVREECDFEVYRACIDWCRSAGVETVPDLRGRIVGPETYQEDWIERCHAVTEE